MGTYACRLKTSLPPIVTIIKKRLHISYMLRAIFYYYALTGLEIVNRGLIKLPC